MDYRQLTAPELISTRLTASTKQEALRELAGIFAKGRPELDLDTVERALCERERLATTGIGDGVAIPHGKIGGLCGVVLAVGLSPAGVPFDAIDGAAVRYFFALLSPTNADGSEHLKALAMISRTLKSTKLRSSLLAAGSPEQVFELLVAQGERS